MANLFDEILEDIKAVKKNDPAAKSYLEIMLCHTPLHSIIIHRLTHPLYKMAIPIVPRMISQFNRFLTGVEIHPGAKIGKGLFIDHGHGLVIGETAEIGQYCTLFHNVTLGGTGHHTGKRHPTLGNHVYIGTASTILGPITIGDHVKIGAESVVIMHDIPPFCTVVGAPGRIVKKDGEKVDMPLPKTPKRF